MVQYIGTAHDVTARADIAAQLDFLHRYDELTGLANRATFHDRLAGVLTHIDDFDTAVALVLVFGSLVAGAVPGVIGGTAVAITLALMVLLSQTVQLSIFSLNLATMLGLGLGIDYSLFIVSRFREELRRGQSVERAIAWSIATAGRAVLFSGATVMIGLLALLTFDITALRSMGMAGALVVLLSVLAALSLLPAVLAVLGTYLGVAGGWVCHLLQ